MNNITITGFTFSEEGTKIYYAGSPLNNSTVSVGMYDLLIRQEKIIAGPVPAGKLGCFLLCDDNKKIALLYDTNLYIKELN